MKVYIVQNAINDQIIKVFSDKKCAEKFIDNAKLSPYTQYYYMEEKEVE